jgi:hypothetical protein
MGDQTSVEAAASLILGTQSEQPEVKEAAPEILEEETQEVGDEHQEDDVAEEDEVVGDSEESEESDEEDLDDGVVESEAGGEFYTVKVDGEEYEVNQAELIKGYQLEKNYTKNNQALLEEKSSIEAMKQELTAERDKYIQFNQQQAQAQNQVLVQAQAKLESIDRVDDPLGYVTQQLEVQEVAKGIEAQRQNWEHAETQTRAISTEQMQKYLAEQSEELAKVMPEWSDPEKGAAVREGVSNFAKTLGYSEAEINSISSARDVVVLNKARLYDEMQSKKAVVRDKRAPAKAKPIVRSKAKASASAAKAQQTKQKRANFKSTGKVGDAANLIFDALNK